MSWLQEMSTNTTSLIAMSSAAVVIAGTIAWGSDTARRRLLKRLKGAPKLQEIERIEEELETKRRQLGDLEKQHAEAKSLMADAERLRSEIAQLEQQRSSLDTVRQNLEALKSEQQQLTAQAEQARSTLAEADTKARVAEQAAMAATVRKDEAESRFEASTTELQFVQEDLGPARDELREKQAGIRQANELIQRAQVLEHHEETIQEFEDKKSELDELANELKDKKLRLVDLEDSLDSVNARYEQRKSEYESQTNPGTEIDESKLHQRLADLWKPTIVKKNTLTANTDEFERLSKVDQYLRDRGLVFHQRTVNAFHTALKVAKEAPLVVLAGISGTGKSLLPQRYAEAMGINFLLVPVQPRWDGPQDLLGFYNFLQEKYVSNDFLQLLIQMQQYMDDFKSYKPNEGGHESLKDQMALILLDEMNLARPEYYFSEFLSRLEIRRTIDESKADERRKSSIPIEVGPLPSGIDKPYIYPGYNTLFVGTMNEDESKQSLSDMVIDRSNVMRFAKPNAMDNSILGTTNPSTPEERLPSSIWEKWKKDSSLDDSSKTRIKDECEKLNEAMAKVGRPFGYRFTKAFSKYAEMYPSNDPNRLKNSIADQIEMRILPKIRGIELDERAEEAIQDILDVISRTEDNELYEAVELANNMEAGRFHWMGVSRELGH